MPERSTLTDACAPTSTSRASKGGKASSGGPPAEFNTLRNAFTPRERRGSTATSRGLSDCTFGLLIISPSKFQHCCYTADVGFKADNGMKPFGAARSLNLCSAYCPGVCSYSECMRSSKDYHNSHLHHS